MGPASQPVAQHYISIGSMYCVRAVDLSHIRTRVRIGHGNVRQAKV